MYISIEVSKAHDDDADDDYCSIFGVSLHDGGRY